MDCAHGECAGEKGLSTQHRVRIGRLVGDSGESVRESLVSDRGNRGGGGGDAIY